MMNTTERITEEIASRLCIEAGMPTTMRELFLNKAYDIVYFGTEAQKQKYLDVFRKETE